jgi:hypothetical protein
MELSAGELISKKQRKVPVESSRRHAKDKDATFVREQAQMPQSQHDQPHANHRVP